MAEKEIVAQIDKLRKTRPARVVEIMAAHYSAASEQLPMLAHDLTTALTFLLLDLKDEARLVEQAKLRGGTSIIKDRLTVASWIQLFISQLDREPSATPPVEREPAPDRTEPVTSHEALNAFVSDMAAQGRGELVAGDMVCPGHVTSDESTWDAHTWLGPMSAEIKSNRWRCADPVQPEQVTTSPVERSTDSAPLSAIPVHAVDVPADGGTVTLYPPIKGPATILVRVPGQRDEVINVNFGDVITNVNRAPMLLATNPGGPHYPSPDASRIEAFLSGASDELFATVPGIPLASAMIGASNDIPSAAEYVATLPSGSMSFEAISADESERQGCELIDRAAAKLGVDLTEQAAHDAIDREYAHMTADPIVDPFAPIPRTVWAPAVPPNGAAWTSADLLAPVDAAFLPAHLSFSQATTVGDCGAKYRMQRIAQIPQVPQWANIGGTTFHTCVQTIEESGNEQALTDRPALDSLWNTTLENEIQMIEQASGMTREQFGASAQGREGYDWWRVEGAAMLQRYVDWRQGAGAGQAVLQGPTARPMLEWETTYNVDGVPFKTILDSVWTDSTQGGMVQGRTAIIRDWKTGSMKPDNRQLCTQAWGLRMAGWEGNVLVQFFDARKGTFSEPFDPFGELGMTWDDVRYFVLSADAQRRLPILPARPSDFCGGCSVAYACPIMSQRKAPKAATK